MSKQTPSPIFQRFLESLRASQFGLAIGQPEKTAGRMPVCEEGGAYDDAIIENLHGPFTVKQLAEHLGTDVATIMRAGRRLLGAGKLTL